MLTFTMVLAFGCAEEEPGPKPGEEMEYVELAYDDGKRDTQLTPEGTRGGAALGTHFSLDEDARLDEVSFYVGPRGVPTAPFAVELWDWSPNAWPHPQNLLYVVEAEAEEGEAWVDVDLSGADLALKGDFLIAMGFTTPPGPQGLNSLFLGVDTTEPSGRSMVRIDESWAPLRFAWGNEGDFMIRATVAR